MDQQDNQIRLCDYCKGDLHRFAGVLRCGQCGRVQKMGQAAAVQHAVTASTAVNETRRTESVGEASKGGNKGKRRE